MVKISKKGYLLTILLVISLKSFALDLQAELDKIELEERIAWKTIMLARLLNEEEQIEALENGIREKMNRNGDFSLNSKIREAEKIYRNKSQRALALQSLLTPKEYVEALNTKVKSKSVNKARAGA